ncbi:MAG: alpha/beta fold hydrolase [Actinocrinis sp.]
MTSTELISEARARFRRQEPQWSAPGEDGLRQAAVEVPLDYADPTAERISIAVARIPALDPRRRRGVLVALNGGPGGNQGMGRFSPLRYAGTPVHEVYDLVGFDPRGWGLSSPLMRESTQGEAPWSSRPADADFEQIALDMKEVEAGAARAGGRLRAHITTRNSARDLDIVRSALGEEKISYIGYAYGTYLGCVYGTMFGPRLDRHVFDSCVDPAAIWRGQYTTQAIAIRRNVDAWAAWTAERDGVFGLGDSAVAVVAAVERIGAMLGANPVGGVDRTAFDGAVGNGATHRPLWDQLAYTVAALGACDFAGVRTAWLFAAPDGERPKAGDTHVPGVVEAITCEGDWSKDLEPYFREMREYRERYPYGYGVSRVQPWVATFRADKPREPLTELRRADYAPGLIVHAEGNPNLNYPGGRDMAARLGDRLVTIADDGSNEVFGVRGNQAVESLVTGYLVDGVLPEADVVVSGTPRPAVPAGARAEGRKTPDTDVVERYLTRFRAAADPRRSLDGTSASA